MYLPDSKNKAHWKIPAGENALPTQAEKKALEQNLHPHLSKDTLGICVRQGDYEGSSHRVVQGASRQLGVIPETPGPTTLPYPTSLGWAFWGRTLEIPPTFTFRKAWIDRERRETPERFGFSSCFLLCLVCFCLRFLLFVFFFSVSYSSSYYCYYYFSSSSSFSSSFFLIFSSSVFLVLFFLLSLFFFLFFFFFFFFVFFFPLRLLLFFFGAPSCPSFPSSTHISRNPFFPFFYLCFSSFSLTFFYPEPRLFCSKLLFSSSNVLFCYPSF